MHAWYYIMNIIHINSIVVYDVLLLLLQLEHIQIINGQTQIVSKNFKVFEHNNLIYMLYEHFIMK